MSLNGCYTLEVNSMIWLRIAVTVRTWKRINVQINPTDRRYGRRRVVKLQYENIDERRKSNKVVLPVLQPKEQTTDVLKCGNGRKISKRMVNWVNRKNGTH